VNHTNPIATPRSTAVNRHTLRLAMIVPVADTYITREVNRRLISREQVIRELVAEYQDLVLEAVRWHDATALGATLETTT
jgi:hypothetical protein